MLDILIKNGTMVDGTGEKRHTGSIGIEKGVLTEATGTEPAKEVIDAHGRIVCPGFIDAHSHGDLLLGTEDGRMFKTVQGITTELCGQCGLSVSPIDADRAEEMHAFFHYRTPLEEMRKWTSFERFLAYVETRSMSANAKFYIGHRVLRMAAMGLENRKATARELDRMKGLLREAMEAGAAGMSTGLVYVPGCYADTEEVVALARTIAPFNGIYASHIRNESAGVVQAVEEVIDIGRRSGARVDISHHKIMGKSNWGLQKKTLELIRQANEEGIYTTCDQYPYTRCMTTLNACIPNWYFSEGLESLFARLHDPAFRDKVRREMEDPATPYDNFYLNAGGFDGIQVVSAPGVPEVEGLTVSAYAASRGEDPWTCFFNLEEAGNGAVKAVFATSCEEDLCEIIQSPYCVVGTDGYNTSWAGTGHPRDSATFPHAINYFVKEKKILTLEQMIHKMTGLTAERLLVPGKGLLKPGYDADVLIIDYERLKDLSTYEKPNQRTEGMDAVIVGGQMVYRDGQFTGNYPGKFVAHKGVYTSPEWEQIPLNREDIVTLSPTQSPCPDTEHFGPLY